MNSFARSPLFRSPAANSCLLALAILASPRGAYAVPFSIQGPGVNPKHFRLTTFASGLNFPLGMAELSDGSLLVAVSDGVSFWSSTGKLIRLTDTDQNGIADGPGTVLFSGLPGGQTSLRVSGKLVFVTGQGRGHPISILRMGKTPADPLNLVGQINVNYPSGGWLHPHSALGIRATPGQPGSCDLLFQLGSEANFAVTARQATLSSPTIAGATGVLEGESIYRLTIIDQTNSVIASDLTRLASGLRNPAGFAFHPRTGDLYFEDNGIDGLVDANEPFSADELNRIPASDIGGAVVENFGFPTTYISHRSGIAVGNKGLPPLVAFQPVPDPRTGEESEGPNDIAFAPPDFPDGLKNGIFVTFHGKFNSGGLNNEENPLVYVDLATMDYFHFIPARLAGIGHLDGLLPTQDSLFVADLCANGNLSGGGGQGVIYQIRSVVLPPLEWRWADGALQLVWPRGVLQEAIGVTGPWNDLPDARSPYPITPASPRKFYRARN